MISKNMCKVLKAIPNPPNKTNFKDLSDKKIVDISFLKSILNDALQYNYIEYIDKTNPYKRIESSLFHLTEAGQVAIEEYKSQKGSSAKATWAIIISALSFIASAVAVVLSICGVQ